MMLGSCIGNRASSNQGKAQSDTIHYAKGFTISRFDNFTQVEIKDPWDTTRLLQRYLLVDRNLSKLPKGMPEGTIVKIPIEKLVVYTSVHASIIEQLKQHERVIGACEVRYIDSKILQERIANGLVANIGESTAPNIEKIMDIGTEAILSSPFKDAGYGPAEKLNIPIIEGADYMENHPLGRVEWLKFYGILLGAEKLADSLFNASCKEYLDLKKLTDSVTKRPTLLAENKYGGQWFVPGGSSYMATLFKDAGADYIFKDTKISGSLPLSFETVLDKAIKADIWVFKYYNTKDMSYADLKTEYSPYAHFDAFKNRKIFACNTSHVTYYEDIPMHPQHILRDFIYIFHPELLPDYTHKYFIPMKD